MIKTYCNNICVCLDSSGSMKSLENDVVKVFDSLISHLGKRSQELSQETRISVITFSDNPQILIFDVDVLRVPQIREHYKTGGQTALIDATIKAIKEMSIIPETSYKDSSWLLYVVTDGMNNINNHLSSNLSSLINGLKDNWTVAVLVPNAEGIHECKRFGFNKDCIQVWDSTSKYGVEEVGRTLRDTTDSYMRARATGIRGTKSLFKLDVNVSPTEIKKNLKELSPSEYEILPVRKDGVDIKSFIESWKLPFKKGANYYELNKPEIVQQYKEVIVQDKVKGTLFSGTNGRKLLNLPSYEVKVSPGDFKDYRIYIQSSSVNRKAVAGTQLVILK